MKKPIRLSLHLQIRNFKNSFLQIGELPFTNLLSDALIKAIRLSGNSYETVFTPLVTLKAFLLQVLSETGCCKDAVSQILIERLSNGYEANSVNTGPYCKARKRLPLTLLKETVTSSAQALAQQASGVWLWKGFQVALVDGTTLLMPDTQDNQKSYPQQSTQKAGLGFPIVRMVGLLSLSARCCLGYATAPYQGKGTGETSLFSQLIEMLGAKDLLLADRYYTSYAIMVMLMKQETAFVFRQSANAKTDFRKGLRLGAKDHIICYKKPKRKPVWMSKEEYEKLPDEVLIREFSVNGIVYVTSLMDSKKYPKKILAELYSKRWNIELDFRTIKTHMGMEMLRCKTAEMIDKEIAVNLLAYNLTCANIAQSAYANDKEPRHISFMATVQLMRCTVGLCMTMTGSTVKKLLPSLLKAISSTEVGKRKRPNQPRVVKRRPKPFPLMTKPRSEYLNA